MHKIFKILTSRMFLFGMTIFIQVILLSFFIVSLSQYLFYFSIIFFILSFITILYIISKKDNPIYKLAWIIPVALIPILGWFIYILGTRRKVSDSQKDKMLEIYNKTSLLCPVNKDIMDEIEKQSKSISNQINYITNTSFFGVCKNTQTKYLSPGEVFWESLCEELEKAEKFIFMEYFIIQEGTMWDRVLDILVKKVKDGVEVKLIYDDLGCIQTLPNNYHKKLINLGIDVAVFNVFRPSIDSFMNYRDHRKITVIDGNVGFMGGNNLADEYINGFVKHGHWKDSSLKLNGDAVWNLTVMFLQMWQYYQKDNVNYNRYRTTHSVKSNGYVLPFSDGPLDEQLIGKLSYINMIMRAKKYVSITTPYLVLDNEMITALTCAAQSGIKVTIITPGIPDKWYVHLVTQYNYLALIEAGVEIFEYTRGFIHSKTIVCDDEIAIVGTQNFDFRSFYLHFECGTLLYKTDSVIDVYNDHTETINICTAISIEDCKSRTIITKLLQVILNLFAPLM